MNLYEYEGKNLFQKHGIKIPKGITIKREDDAAAAYANLGVADVVVKAQVLSGKRGKNNGIRFCSSAEEVAEACKDIFNIDIRGQYVAAIHIEEKLDIAEEHYLSILYNTNTKQPMVIYSAEGGVDIEDVAEEKITKQGIAIKAERAELDMPFVEELWQCFKQEDTRLVEINPLVKTTSGDWIAADAKVAIDDDAFFRHDEWKQLEPRTMMGRPPTEREMNAKKIDEGEAYYRGTAGKYIEMDGDIGLVLIGGGASIACMDAIQNVGLKAANYTEYSGNPPREKVYELSKLVMTKPGIRGLWVSGVVANFTNIKDTFEGFVDALDELKPTYPIVVRRDGPYRKEGFELLQACVERNNLNLKMYDKDTSMTETVAVLAEMVK